MPTNYKKTKEKHFTAKSAARVVAYARRDGASDVELMRYIIEAYGLREISCLMSQSLLVLTNKIFVDNIIFALIGCLGLLKGFKIVAEGRISSFTIVPLDHFFRIYFAELATYYGAFVIFVSGSITIVSTMITFFDTMADQIEYYFFMDDVCSAEQMTNPFPIEVKPPNFELFYQEDQAEQDFLERYGSLADQIFPDSVI